MEKKNSNYHQGVQIPIKIIKSNRRTSSMPKKTKFGLFLQFFKKAVNFILIVLLISAQVYLLSAFEAHVINVTAHICRPSETRTMGYWKNHPEVYINCLPQTLGDETVSTPEEVDLIFENANADEMRDMLKGQLLAMKFNIGCFGIDDSEGEEFEGKTLAQIVAEADDLLRADPEPPREVLEEMKDLLDYINNLHQIKYCSSGPTYSSATIEEPLSIESLLQESAEANLFSLIDNESQSEENSEDLFNEIPEEVVPPEDTSSEETVTPPQDGVNLIGGGGGDSEETSSEEASPESTGEPTEEEPVTEETTEESTEEPTEETPSEEPTTEEPVTEESSTEEPTTEGSSTEEPPTDETSVEEPSTEEPPTEETSPAEEPPAEEPPPTEEESPPAEEPSVEEEPPTPAEEPPAEEQPPAEEPPAEEPPTEEAPAPET